MRNLNDKNSQLQKQLDNVIREGIVPACHHQYMPSLIFMIANSEITLLNNKRAGMSTTRDMVRCVVLRACHTELERDLEVEKRKVRDLQEANREAEKEYQKLKVRVRFSYFSYLTPLFFSGPT